MMMTTKTELDHESYWKDAFTWEEYLEEEVEENRDLWAGVHRTHETPDWAIEQVADLGSRLRLLVLTEDWCGDASNSVPVVARLAESAPGLELRLVKRDENLELMDEYLTDGGRAIPKVVVLDDDFRPVADWGPRPAELQEFVISEKEQGERPASEIYADARRWYARDKGETTLRELVDVLRAAAER